MQQHEHMAQRAGMVSGVQVSHGVVCNCITHALTTEKEEIMGLLLGDTIQTETGERVTQIWRAVPQVRNDRRKDRVECSGAQMAEVAQQAERITAQTGRTTRVVGWYHSHPHITVLPSHIDVNTQASYQALDAGFVGLIVSCFNSMQGPDEGDRVSVIAFQAELDGASNQEEEPVDAEEEEDAQMRQALAASRAYMVAQRSSSWVKRIIPLHLQPPAATPDIGAMEAPYHLQAALVQEEWAPYEAEVAALESEPSIPAKLLRSMHGSAVVCQSLADLVQGSLLPSLAALHSRSFSLEQRRLEALQRLEKAIQAAGDLKDVPAGEARHWLQVHHTKHQQEVAQEPVAASHVHGNQKEQAGLQHAQQSGQLASHVTGTRQGSENIPQNAVQHRSNGEAPQQAPQHADAAASRHAQQAGHTVHSHQQHQVAAGVSVMPSRGPPPSLQQQQQHSRGNSMHVQQPVHALLPQHMQDAAHSRPSEHTRALQHALQQGHMPGSSERGMQGPPQSAWSRQRVAQLHMHSQQQQQQHQHQQQQGAQARAAAQSHQPPIPPPHTPPHLSQWGPPSQQHHHQGLPPQSSWQAQTQAGMRPPGRTPASTQRLSHPPGQSAAHEPPTSSAWGPQQHRSTHLQYAQHAQPHPAQSSPLPSADQLPTASLQGADGKRSFSSEGVPKVAIEAFLCCSPSQSVEASPAAPAALQASMPRSPHMASDPSTRALHAAAVLEGLKGQHSMESVGSQPYNGAVVGGAPADSHLSLATADSLSTAFTLSPQHVQGSQQAPSAVEQMLAAGGHSGGAAGHPWGAPAQSERGMAPDCSGPMGGRLSATHDREAAAAGFPREACSMNDAQGRMHRGWGDVLSASAQNPVPSDQPSPQQLHAAAMAGAHMHAALEVATGDQKQPAGMQQHWQENGQHPVAPAVARPSYAQMTTAAYAADGAVGKFEHSTARAAVRQGGSSMHAAAGDGGNVAPAHVHASEAPQGNLGAPTGKAGRGGRGRRGSNGAGGGGGGGGGSRGGSLNEASSSGNGVDVTRTSRGGGRSCGSGGKGGRSGAKPGQSLESGQNSGLSTESCDTSGWQADGGPAGAKKKTSRGGRKFKQQQQRQQERAAEETKQ